MCKIIFTTAYLVDVGNMETTELKRAVDVMLAMFT